MIALIVVVPIHILVKKQEELLFQLIDDTYGSPEELAEYLDLGIEMLFYLEEDTFEKRDVQSVVSALRGIIGVLRNKE